MATRPLPKTMKAAAIDRYGPPSVLKLHELPVRTPRPDQVLIAVHAAGVGSWDAEIRDGSWQPGKKKFPIILGYDGAGVVVAKGAKVRRLRVGDHVWAASGLGFYAEYVAVDADSAAKVPRGLDLLEAGTACVVALTALQGIERVLEVRRGETVLVYGASGSVGTYAVQFARARGARVLATASGRDAQALVKKLGASGSFDARSAHAVEKLHQLAPDGVDAVLALAGGDALQACLSAVRRGGRVAYPNGVEPEPKRAGLRIASYDVEPTPREFARLDRAVKKARLKVPIAAEFPLARAAAAHERLERGHVLGRIAIKVRRGV